MDIGGIVCQFYRFHIVLHYREEAEDIGVMTSVRLAVSPAGETAAIKGKAFFPIILISNNR
jgi:hypothetical protein